MNTKGMTNLQRHVDASLTSPSMDGFVALVKQGMDCWTEAGQMLVGLVEKDPGVYARIIKSNPTITFEMLLAFERMGRKQIYPPLLMDASPGAKKLLELPYEAQEKFSIATIDVLMDASNGELVISKKYVKELSGYEAKMVFGQSTIRTVDEQVEFSKTHSRQGRKPRQKNSKIIGTFLIKVSPSGAVVIEKTNDKTMCPKLVLFERDGVKQCAVNISQ